MERTTKFAIEQLFKKGVRGVDLQPLHYAPFNGKIQQEGGRQRNGRNPTNKFNYSVIHNSSNSKIPSNRKPANGCIKYWLSISDNV